MLFKTKNYFYNTIFSTNLLKFNVKKDKYTSLQLSKILKITINRGLGKFYDNKLLSDQSIKEFRLITGQHPKLVYSKKAISGFKLREKVLIGLTVTLRKTFMYSFLDRLIHIALPQIPNFAGYSISNFDNFGNYNFGIKDQSIFPEIPYEDITQQLGFNVTIVFKQPQKALNLLTLKTLGFPFCL